MNLPVFAFLRLCKNDVSGVTTILPTWVIGPQVGIEPFPERPADILTLF